MFRRFSVNFAVFSIFLDAFLIVGLLGGITYLRPSLNPLPFAAPVYDRFTTPMVVYPLFAVIWISIFLLTAVYDGRRNLRLLDEVGRLTLGSVIAAVSMAGTLYLSYREISRLLFVLFVALTYLAMLAWRLGVRLLASQNKTQNAPGRRVLIVGAGPVGVELQRKIQESKYLGLHVVGFLDDDVRKQSARQQKGQPAVLGGVDQARTVTLDLNIDEVVIALPQRAYARVNQLAAELHDLPVKVWVIPDYFSLALHKAVIEEFAGIPMLDLRAPALSDYQRMLKRFFDLSLTLALLPLALPLMALIALAIRLEGPGPILFPQLRVGENGRLFTMLKFRTMVVEAEALRGLVEQKDENGNIIHKTLDDPRVTRVGRLLRRSSLDELPQLVNILRGEMSLVGPRPELPYLVDRYEPWQRKRFAVPQGVTGWWQINGRSDKPMHLHTEDDLYYVQHYSIWLDIRILLRTVGAVLRGKGAY